MKIEPISVEYKFRLSRFEEEPRDGISGVWREGGLFVGTDAAAIDACVRDFLKPRPYVSVAWRSFAVAADKRMRDMFWSALVDGADTPVVHQNEFSVAPTTGFDNGRSRYAAALDGSWGKKA